MKVLLFALAASSLTAGGFAPVDRHLGPPTGQACARLDQQTVAPDGVRLFKRLDQLPKGVLEHAVWRTVSGCPVREIVFDGRTYYVTSANPLIERLDPVAHGPVDQH
jgi:hypothetical protein